MNKQRQIDTELSRRIAHARKKSGLNQKDLAEKLGISYPTLNRYEVGRRSVPGELLIRIIEITGCDPAWLLTGIEADKARSEKISEIQKILSGMTAAEGKEPYGLTNRDKFWMEVGRHLDQVEGAEHLRRIIYDAFRAAHVPVDEIEKRYRY